MMNRNVSIRLACINGYAYHLIAIITGIDWNDEYYQKDDEVLLLKDFGNFGELEFATYDWRH